MTDDTATPQNSKARLVGLVGVACCAALTNYVPQFEGTVLRGYKDPIGIVTACTGDTYSAVLGKPYTKDECTQILYRDLVTHADGVLKCVPQLKDKPYPLAASVSLGFNIGVTAYCDSIVARKFRAGDDVGACNDFPLYVHAGGKVLPGLVHRRQVERQMCLGQID